MMAVVERGASIIPNDDGPLDDDTFECTFVADFSGDTKVGYMACKKEPDAYDRRKEFSDDDFTKVEESKGFFAKLGDMIFGKR